MSESDSLVEHGRELLKRGRWQEARAAFERALAVQASAEAFEGLGTACSWLNDGEGVVRAREKAFRLYEEADDVRSAARVATWLANEYGEFRGEGAVARGWLERAQRLVQDLAPCEEQAIVLVATASARLFMERDPAGARELAVRARTIAERVKSVDGLMMANAIEGLSRVSGGEMRQGMRLLDEAAATAVGGQCENLTFVGTACCCLIAACECVRDYDRAAQWCNFIKGFCRRWRIGSLFALCRTLYSAVLISRGEWAEAEEELAAATEELLERRPALVVNALVRLAELRRRQGRFAEAKSLLGQVEFHVLSLLGRSTLALDEGDAATASDYAQRLLRRLPPQDKIERVPGLEMLIRACTARGDLPRAREALAELRDAIREVSTESLKGTARFTEGVLAAAEGQLRRAQEAFEDAVDLFEKAVLPYETATARIELSRVLVRLGRGDRAQSEALAAHTRAVKLGAGHLERRAEEILSAPPPRSTAAVETGLSAREREVLLLVAEGKDNARIADELFLSVRTVERHVSNAYQKLGISGKSARTAATVYALKNLAAQD